MPSFSFLPYSDEMRSLHGGTSMQPSWGLCRLYYYLFSFQRAGAPASSCWLAGSRLTASFCALMTNLALEEVSMTCRRFWALSLPFLFLFLPVIFSGNNVNRKDFFLHFACSKLFSWPELARRRSFFVFFARVEHKKWGWSTMECKNYAFPVR